LIHYLIQSAVSLDNNLLLRVLTRVSEAFTIPIPNINNQKIRIGIIAGEVSGDQLGASLILALKQKNPFIEFEGIAGPEMAKAGCKVLCPMEHLAVMGVVDVIAKLPQLLSIRRRMIHHFIKSPPDIYIGIDAPDFNIPIERVLRKKGILTVHYNSPTIWAWRRNRLKTIRRSTDLMLTIFPFEKKYYDEAGIPARYIGHPLADTILEHTDPTKARSLLHLPLQGEIIAILPGSRASEIKHLGEVFLKTALYCLERRPGLQFITPMVNEARKEQFLKIKNKVAPHLPLHIYIGQSQEVMAASSAILLASGTATLEAMLLKRPMVVAYRFSLLNYLIARVMIKIKHFSLPNLLAGETLVPEFFQGAVTTVNLGSKLLAFLEHPHHFDATEKKFIMIHNELRQEASQKAAEAITNLITNTQ
jgi:lipid-A-disaccharide synthase